MNNIKIYFSTIFLLLLLNKLKEVAAVDGVGGNSVPLNIVVSNMNSQRSEKTNTGSIPSNLKQNILNLSKIFTRKPTANSLTTVNQPSVSINADHVDKTDQWQNVAVSGDQLLHGIAPPMSADHDAEPVQSLSYDRSSSAEHVNFDEYWRTVLSFHQQKSHDSEPFIFKVPLKVIAKIILKMIDAFKNYMVGINDQKINDLDGIPLPDKFMVNRQSDIATPFLEKELLGDVQIIYNVAPEHKFFYAFLYKSPQQLMDNLNKTADEIDIVWTFGVILYGMLSNNEHPFEGLKEQILDQNDSYRNNKILQLSLHYKIYVDNHGQIWGKGQTLRKNLQKKIEFFLKNGDELPIPYDNVMPTDLLCDNDDADDQYVCINEYEPLINLTKQCLQTYKDKRILMSDLRKQLEEITCEK